MKMQMHHSIRMIGVELHLLICILIIFLSITTTIAHRCYLCSESILPECTGSTQLDSSIYTAVLQYYTEPCNGQCVLFRNENHSVVRGCSWTYGHMTAKSVGWHEISPGIPAYFCNSHLCNNGTYEQPQFTVNRELVLLTGNNPLLIQTEHSLSRQLHQCYSCTARSPGCSEYLDPRYALNYIRPCSSSCIIFRNPNDFNVITRDCATFWPEIGLKNGLQKLLGSDAFLCQESFCNGISFDFIMGIFYNQSPIDITFPPTSTSKTSTTLMDIYNDSMIWDDPDLDYDSIESTTVTITNHTTTTVPLSIDQFDSINETLSNISISEVNSSLSWWDFNDTSSLPSISSTVPIDDDDDSIMLNTTTIFPVTRFERLSIDDTINQTSDDIFTSTIILPYTINNQLEEELIEYIKPFPTLAMPPFSWMLNQARQNQSEPINSTTTTSEKIQSTTSSNVLFEYCKIKQCHHNGRLTSDCLCICLPAFTGNHCETVLCEQEPVHICTFVLEHECELDHIRYLCPKFCQIQNCTLPST